MKLVKNKKGFTLVEIIVVLVIMGILLAIAVPTVVGYVNKAAQAKDMAIARSINLETTTYYQEYELKNGGIKDFEAFIKQMKKDFSYGQNNKLKTLITTEPIKDYELYSIDCDFDGLYSDNGWNYDKSLSRHTLTKITITFRNDKYNLKFYVTLLNKNMYFYDSSNFGSHLGKEDGPVLSS